MDKTPSTILQVHLSEFDKIKNEQFARIGFRDNLVYVTLVAFGCVIAFAVTDNHYALLILPWVSLILGWNYLINDEKVSAIGRYVRHSLAPKIAASLDGVTEHDILGWEAAHRSDPRRFRRKFEQLVIDEVVFVLSGLGALIAFWMMEQTMGWPILIVTGFEAFMLLVLAIEIILYADMQSGR